LVQLVPAFVEVAKPMSDAPPLNRRPIWRAVTIVEPEAKMPGSTSVACWLSEFVKVSVLNRAGKARGGSEGVLWPPPHPNIENRASTTSVKAKQALVTQPMRVVAHDRLAYSGMRAQATPT
jgi:hypothetical protein